MTDISKEKLMLGRRLADVRNRFQLSQEKFAEHLGCSKNTISRYENGQTIPDIFMIIKIAERYDLDITELIPEIASLNKSNGGWSQVMFKADRLNSVNKEAVINTTNAMVDNLLEAEKKYIIF